MPLPFHNNGGSLLRSLALFLELQSQHYWPAEFLASCFHYNPIYAIFLNRQCRNLKLGKLTLTVNFIINFFWLCYFFVSSESDSKSAALFKRKLYISLCVYLCVFMHMCICVCMCLYMYLHAMCRSRRELPGGNSPNIRVLQGLSSRCHAWREMPLTVILPGPNHLLLRAISIITKCFWVLPLWRLHFTVVIGFNFDPPPIKNPWIP